MYGCELTKNLLHTIQLFHGAVLRNIKIYLERIYNIYMRMNTKALYKS